MVSYFHEKSILFSRSKFSFYRSTMKYNSYILKSTTLYFISHIFALKYIFQNSRQFCFQHKSSHSKGHTYTSKLVYEAQNSCFQIKINVPYLQYRMCFTIQHSKLAHQIPRSPLSLPAEPCPLASQSRTRMGWMH